MEPLSNKPLVNSAIADLDNNRFTELNEKINKHGCILLASLIDEATSTKDNSLSLVRVQKCLKFDNESIREIEKKYIEAIIEKFDAITPNYFIENAFKNNNIECAKLLILHQANIIFKAKLSDDFTKLKNTQNLNNFIENAKISITLDNARLLLAAHNFDTNSFPNKLNIITDVLKIILKFCI